MNETEERLSKIFRDIFPELPESEIRDASQESVPGWETVAETDLIDEIEERFAIVVDYDRIPALNSFASILAYLETRLRR